ncbi:MAG: stage III sporulation AC/AD family protein [Clostridium sp.]|nr:stage III sporulation AC/AD family protein [Clostridium sp.]
MIKIIAVVLITLVLVIFLKDVNREFSFLLTVAASILLFGLIINDFFDVINSIDGLSSNLGNIKSYINLMIKILGIAIVSQFVIDLCKDSGENALASQTELASKIIILIMIMPLFNTVLNVVTGLLK